jgi:spore maturation protein SpmB
MALRAATGSADPAGIIPTTLFATLCSTITAVLAARLYGRFFSRSVPDRVEANEDPVPLEKSGEGGRSTDALKGYRLWVSLTALGLLLACVPLTILYGRSLSPWIIPALMAGFLAFGVIRRVRVYEVFVEGAKEGFRVAIRIIPYLVAILVAVGMLRASGAMDALVGWLGRWTASVGMPAEALPMALLRPLSGSGAYGVMASIIQDPAIGPDSYTGYLVSTLQGSTETTFYVLAVYFGAVQVRRIRHALAAALTADLAGIVFAVVGCLFLYGQMR